jgi:beta-glucosidase
MTPWKTICAAAALVVVVSSTGAGQYQSRPDTAPRFRWPEGKRAAVTLTFDDGRPSQVDSGVPLFDQYGVKATFFVVSGSLNQRLDAWKKAAAAGHEIANHSVNHPCSGNFDWSRERALENYTLDQMRAELTSANAEVQKLIGVTPSTFAYPCGQKFVGQGRALQSYVPLIAELFTAGRGWLDEAANDPRFCDLAQLMGVESDNKTFNQIRPLLEQAAESGTWLILAGHDIGSGDARQTTQLAMLGELCRYAQDPAHGLWIDTVQTIASYVARDRISPPSTDARIESLISQMTLEEKLGQMNMPCVYEDALGKDVAAKTSGCRAFAEGTHEPGIGPGGGFFTLANTILLQGPRQQAEYFNALQKIALEKTRLKIPLLQSEEGTHGLMCSGATIFPEGLALGSTWDPALLKDVYATAAREARSVGIHQLYTLVIEPNRDPRLGRNQEGYSEDPYLCARIAEAIVHGVQGDNVNAPDKVVAGFCHYPGQSQPAGGLERGAMQISPRLLREVFLPPWVAGIKKGHALGVMATYPAIDGVPVHGSEEILTRILRDDLGFEGLVLSEGGGISTLRYEGLAATDKIAGELALKAGLDVGISYEKGYMQLMAENVREGKVPMALIDRAVRRILTQKTRLGLFDKPFVDPETAVKTVHAPANVDLALRAAREGIVLLKNEGGLLPLRKTVKSIAVIGPNANDAKNQLGDYTSHSILQKIVTVLDGVRAKVPAAKVTYVKGCDVIGDGLNEIERARAAAKAAEVAIVVLGENEWGAEGKKGTNGEGYDVATLELTGMQEQLIKAVHGTGTPTVAVMLNGRPLAIRWIAEKVPAIVEPWMCGERGGEAVADVLFGDYNPGGKLTVTVPRHVGQYPFFYNYMPSKGYWLKDGWGRPYPDLDKSGPLWEFGFGLSYTEFTYSNLVVENKQIPRDGKVSIRVDVKNSGKIAGDEVVQLYIHDKVATVTQPVQQLRGFERITLAPGETRTVRFTLGPEEFAILDRQLKWTVEPGEFDVMIGSSSKDIRLKDVVEVVGQ